MEVACELVGRRDRRRGLAALGPGARRMDGLVVGGHDADDDGAVGNDVSISIPSFSLIFSRNIICVAKVFSATTPML